MQFPEKSNNCSFIIAPCPANRRGYAPCALVKGFIGIIFFLSSSTLLAYNTVTDSLLYELQKTKEACPDCAGDTTVVKILNKLCWEYKSNDPATALQYGWRALSLAKQLLTPGKSDENDAIKRGIATSLNNIGQVNSLQGNYEKAMDYLLQSLKMREEMNDKKGIAVCLNNIGGVYYHQGNQQKTIEYFLQALKILEKLGDRQRANTCLNNIGGVYYSQANYEKAIEYYLKSLVIAEELGLKQEIALLSNNIGAVYKEQTGMLTTQKLRKPGFKKALKYYFKALKANEKSDNKHWLSINLNNIAEVYSEQGDYNKAIEYTQRSLDIVIEIGAKEQIKHAWQILAETYAKQGHYKKAYKYYQLYSEIKDSLFNENSFKRIAEMQAQYESEKKERKITFLKKEKELQAIKLKQRTTQRNAFIVGFGLVIILALVVLIAYRQSKIAAQQKAQRQIEKHLHEIDLLRANINMELPQSAQKFKVTINQEELNRYLLNPMTERELDVLYLISDGKTNKEIADKLYVSVNTIKTHILKIYEKLDVSNRTQAVVKAGGLDILNNKIS